MTTPWQTRLLVFTFLWCCDNHVTFAFVPPKSSLILSSPALAKVFEPNVGFRPCGLCRQGHHLQTTSSQRTRTTDSGGDDGRRSSTSIALSFFPSFGGIELNGLAYDSVSTAFDAWEWTNGMGAPAALVAGAVLVTLGETREQAWPRKSDNGWIRFLKQSMRFLLLTAFALEVVSIFVSTVTGSILLGHGTKLPKTSMLPVRKIIGYEAPLQLMHHHHEFEYLTTQICFLQGLLNWLAASAVELYLPKKDETKSARIMNKCLASWLISLIVWILAFFNHHLSFYSDYFAMLRRFASLFLQQYIFERPIRPLSLLYCPLILYSIRLTWKAFCSPRDEDH